MKHPSREYQATRITAPTTPHKGLDRVVHEILGHYRRNWRIRHRWQTQSERIFEHSLRHRDLSDHDLKNRLDSYRTLFRRRKQDDGDKLSEALALIAEASARAVGMRPYRVQILGAIVIHHGCLAEMATGEGKSLTACLPAIIAGWSGRPCHIVTANDYLASRDAEAFAPLYNRCGLSSGWIGQHMTPAERRSNHHRHVVYATGKELLADFLRDRLIMGNRRQASQRIIHEKRNPHDRAFDGRVMRGIDTAFVDEADSVLIDEAVTPLIISQTQENKPLIHACRHAARMADDLLPESDYVVDRRFHEISLTNQGKAKISELSANLTGIFRGEARREELVLNALSAREFYQKNKQYVVEKDGVVIVDEFTGRMMPQRTWRHGLHQAIEAREGLPLSNPSETLARLSFQRFFRFFRKLGAMTGTASEASNEFWHMYQLPVLRIPTNRPCIRKALQTRCHPDQDTKWQAICHETATCHRTGQPVLVGTRSVHASETLAALLKKQDIPFHLLNAVRHREEAKIIALAGHPGAVTIATNMAGRGADIRLGKGVADLGGLHVIVSEPHESARIDRQLYGRCARQGDPGSYRMHCSGEDELIRRYGTKPLAKLFSLPIPKSRLVEKLILRSQRNAQRQAFQRRNGIMQMDDWLTDALSFAQPEFDG